ncbi:MAG: pyridoxal phosphate-dependent decarboxylase family protein [Bryobacteraceae bacterium]
MESNRKEHLQLKPNETTVEEFRAAGYKHIDWIANYLSDPRKYPVYPNIRPGDLTAKLPTSAPESGDSLDAIFSDFESLILPALTLWNHPRFFGYFSISSTPAGILAELLAATVNVNAMLWKSSPAATELEQVTLRWLRDWVGLSDQFFGIIYDTASVGVMQALGAAREHVDPSCRTEGMKPGLTVYISEHTHSSSEKAAITLGFGQNNVRRIAVDEQFRMRPEKLIEAIESDITAGKRPCFVVASVGSTSTTAIEPVAEIAAIAEKYHIWLHVDAAYGGPAAVVPEMRHVLNGAERAHSIVLNPHKWLYVPIDCSVLYTRFPEVLKRASSLSAEYLRTAEDDQAVNFMDYGVQLGRRFRALKLWYVFRYYGREGIVAMLRESLRLAQLLKELVEASPDFELAAPVPLSLVCFRFRGTNELNERLLAAVNNTGSVFLSHTILNARFVLRFAIGNFMTTEQDVRQSWELITDLAQGLAEREASLTGKAR